MFRNLKKLGRPQAVQRRKPLFLENLEPRCMLSSYSLVDLGFLPGAFFNSTRDINAAGQVVGMSGEHAMVWTPAAARDGTGIMTDLGVLTGYDYSEAQTISSNAWIAGILVGASNHVPCVWIPSSMTTWNTALPISQATGQALGVNSSGTVVGVSGVDWDLSERAFVWERNASGAYQGTDLNTVFPPGQIPELPGSGDFWIHEATAINDRNQIVANGLYLEDADHDGYHEISRQWGFLLEDNNGWSVPGGITVTNLGALGSRQYTYATDINNLGQIVGASASARTNQGWRAYLWQDGAMQDLGTLAKDPSSYALGVSDTGLVVGYSGTAGGYPHPWIWQNGRITALQSTIPADFGWTLRHAYAVNDRGEIVGSGEDPRDSGYYSWRGFLLSTSVTLPTISIGDASVTEGDSATTAAQLTITLSEPPGPGQSISLDYYTTGCYNDSASPGLDFITAAGTVTFDAGQTSQVVTVQVKGDRLAGVNADSSGNTDQGNEVFYVNLANPRNGAGVQTAVFLDAQGKVTIVEDEPAMSISDVAYPEGNEGLTPFTFTVLLSMPAKDTVTVHWRTADNSAKAGEDYDAADDDLVIAAGASSGTFTVWVRGDKVKEDWEVFSVQLDKATVQNAYIPDLSSRTGGFAWGRIENDDRVTKPAQPASRISAALSGADSTLLYAAAMDAAWADHGHAREQVAVDDQLLLMLVFDQLR